MASKERGFDDWRREAAEARDFPTRYYNAAVHQAALAAPEFFLQAVAEDAEAQHQQTQAPSS